MFIPNTFGSLSTLTGMTADAEPRYAAARRVPCAISKLNQNVMKTSLRIDSSASRGDAEETKQMSIIMFPANVPVAVNDRFQIAGYDMKATDITPCYSVMGQLDHFEVQFLTLVETE